MNKKIIKVEPVKRNYKCDTCMNVAEIDIHDRFGVIVHSYCFECLNEDRIRNVRGE